MSEPQGRIGELADTAEQATAEASAYLRDRFDAGVLEAEYTAMDVKTEADVGAESRILEVIREHHPEQAITAEESGHHPGEGDVRWVVDPLDGTNNFAIGSPLFGIAVTAIGAEDHAHEGQSLATSLAVPTMGEQYVATRGGGVSLNGERIAASEGDQVAPAQATVACVIGEPVLESDVLAADHDAISTAIRSDAKRLIHTWAPIVYWGLLAKGGLDAFVSFYADEREQAAGRLVASEAECVQRGEEPLTVFATNGTVADAVWDAARGSLDAEPTPRDQLP